MRNLAIYLAGLAALSGPSAALGPASASFRDLLGYPKYEVLFLNDLPISESDARRLRGQESGASSSTAGLDHEDDWWNLRVPHRAAKRLGDGQGNTSENDRLELLPMNLRHPEAQADSLPEDYLCLLPSKNSTMSQTAQAELHDDDEVELDPAESWKALSHLTGKCLYSRQGWFTYSYCHDSHIRQFREARHAHPHPPGGHVPEEDRSFDAYTLGQAYGPSTRKSKAALPPGHTSSSTAKAGDTAAGGAVDRSRSTLDREEDHSPVTYGSGVGSGGPGTSSRYLLQRWGDGTRCDKTGRPREIEVQVHCSMTTTDSIYLVRELAICSYVMIIHSPHLCSLPGFKAEGAVEIASAPITCRHVLPDNEWNEWVHRAERGADPVDGKDQQTLAAGQEDTDAHVGGGGGSGGGGWWSGHQHGKTAVERLLEGAEQVRASGDLVPDKHKVSVPLLGADELKLLAQGSESLADLVGKALEAMARAKDSEAGVTDDPNAETDAGVDEVVFFSVDEGEDGEPLLVDILDLSAGAEAEKGSSAKEPRGDEDRKMIMDAVKHFLNQKHGAKKEGKGGEGEQEERGPSKEGSTPGQALRRDEL